MNDTHTQLYTDFSSTIHWFAQVGSDVFPDDGGGRRLNYTHIYENYSVLHFARLFSRFQKKYCKMYIIVRYSSYMCSKIENRQQFYDLIKSILDCK